ncbi:unnamed protein product [Amaranthus hypochondriacus]
MSNSIGQNVNLLLEQHQSKVNSGIPIFKAQATSKLRNSAIFTKKFYGKKLRSSSNTQKLMDSRRFSYVARAVLAADPASQAHILLSNQILLFGPKYNPSIPDNYPFGNKDKPNMALLQFPLLLNFRSSLSPGNSFFRRRDFKVRCSEERQTLFNRIAPVYDNLNDLLSLGQHRVWKRMAVSWSGAKVGDNVLDICCGSGDLAFLLSEKVGVDGQVLGLDFSREQLLIASSRQQERSSACYKNIEWLQGDALNLPFPDDTFDAMTMGYGLRNVVDKERAIQEIFRVLKPGCKVSILDFNKSNQPIPGLIQEWMIDNVVVPVATVYGLADEYKYLKSSIQEFLTGKELEQLALSIGFSDAKFYEISGGLMGNLVATC